jgi:sugar lactone lactonase YvrE
MRCALLIRAKHDDEEPLPWIEITASRFVAWTSNTSHKVRFSKISRTSLIKERRKEDISSW